MLEVGMSKLNSVLTLVAVSEVVVCADPGNPAFAEPVFHLFLRAGFDFIFTALYGTEGDKKTSVGGIVRLVSFSVEGGGDKPWI